MWRNQTFKSGEMVLADGVVIVDNYCISAENLTPAQIAKLEAHSKWVRSPDTIGEPTPVGEPPPPKRKRGRPRKNASK